MNYFDESTEKVLSELETSVNGLTSSEAERRLSRYGKNEITEQKKKGVGIVFVGEDLDVMLALCDKILVLCHGEVMGVVHASKTTKEELGMMMTGSLDLTNVKEYGIARDSNLSEEEWSAAAAEDNTVRGEE